jgi:sec-independent protein translocase protein TatB
VMGIDPEKLLALFIIALIVLGPERLPKMARSLGRGLAELRKYTSSAQNELHNVLAEPREAVRSVLAEVDLPDLSDLANPLAPLRYIDAPSQPRLPSATPSGDVTSSAAPAVEGAEGAGLPSGAEGFLPDDPSLN